MRVRVPAFATALTAAVLLTTACGEQGITSPTAPSAPALAPAAAPLAAASRATSMMAAAGSPFDTDGDGVLSADERAARSAADAAQFESLRDQWQAYKDSVTRGSLAVQVARCAPQPRLAAARTIGREGGVLAVGPHTLHVPQGALAAPVKITAVATAGGQRKVEFAPHGLRFAKPVRLTSSYEACTLPADAVAEIVYTGAADVVIARQPSLDSRGEREVEAWTDHFSGYLVGYGRR
jgi:hypothetical protein